MSIDRIGEIMKKGIFFFITLVFFVIGCNNSNKVNLNIIGENASNLKALNALKTEYETKTGIKISYHPYSFDDAFTKANQDFATGSGIYDIVMQYNFSLSSFVRNDYVYKIGDIRNNIPKEKMQFESDLFQNAWHEIGYFKDQNDTSEVKIGYPFATNTMILAYNKELFTKREFKDQFKLRYGKELLPPKNWDEYFQIAEFFTMKNRNLFGVCLQGSTGSWLYYEWCNFLFGMGGKFMDKKYGWEENNTKRILLDSKEAINATNFYLKLKPFNAGDYLTVGAYEQIRLMKRGNIAMAIIWSDLAYELVNEGDDKYDERFGFVTIPGNISGLAGGSFFINKKSKHPEQALNYIVDVLQKENQIKLIQQGLCSPLKSAYEANEVRNIPYLQALKESLARGKYMYEAGIDASMISEKVTTYIQKIWKGDIGVEKGLSLMKEEIEKERAILYKGVK